MYEKLLTSGEKIAARNVSFNSGWLAFQEGVPNQFLLVETRTIDTLIKRFLDLFVLPATRRGRRDREKDAVFVSFVIDYNKVKVLSEKLALT